MEPQGRAKSFVWRTDGHAAKFLKNLFKEGTIDANTPFDEMYTTYQHVWPGKLYCSHQSTLYSNANVFHNQE